jgi:hypothetical protein
MSLSFTWHPLTGDGRHMDKLYKMFAWICIVSTLLMGCHSSGVIYHAENEDDATYQERISSEPISYVVTKSGTRYDFHVENPPTVTQDAIVGEVMVPIEGEYMLKKVSIPVSDVAFVSVKQNSVSVKRPGLTGLWIALGLVAVVGVVVCIATAGTPFGPHL